MTVISNASCTTNCLVPLVKVLHEKVGVLAGVMNTIHSYTNDQVLTDVYHTDLRRARSATMSMIPTKTGAAAAVGLVMPELKGKIDGFSIRVPTINVSLGGFQLHRGAQDHGRGNSRRHQGGARGGALKGILAYNDQPLVSVDFNHDPASSTYDATLTKVIEGTLVKACSWYDNEWGFSNRMLDTDPGVVESLLRALLENHQNDQPGSARQAGADSRGSECADPGRRGQQRCANPRGPADHSGRAGGEGARAASCRISAGLKRASTRRSFRSRRWPSAWRSCWACRCP